MPMDQFTSALADVAANKEPATRAAVVAHLNAERLRLTVAFPRGEVARCRSLLSTPHVGGTCTSLTVCNTSSDREAWLGKPGLVQSCQVAASRTRISRISLTFEGNLQSALPWGVAGFRFRKRMRQHTWHLACCGAGNRISVGETIGMSPRRMVG